MREEPWGFFLMLGPMPRCEVGRQRLVVRRWGEGEEEEGGEGGKAFFPLRSDTWVKKVLGQKRGKYWVGSFFRFCQGLGRSVKKLR